MTTILEDRQQKIANELLALSNIYEVYKEDADTLLYFIKQAKETLHRRHDKWGKEIKLPPGEIVRMSLTYSEVYSEELLNRISGLEYSEKSYIKVLYRQLSELNIVSFEKPDKKGLYLLAARAAEENGVFDE